jgi:SAM-dependent methyltransferase
MLTSSQRAPELRSHIASRLQAGGIAVQTLEPRKRDELEFHDRYRDASAKQKLGGDEFDQIYGNERFYRVTEVSLAYTKDWVARNSPGKIFLDFACGDGGNSRRAAAAGAELAVGIDLSDLSVQNCRRDADSAGLADKTLYLQADCENTGFPDGSFDTIICSGVLHHMDLSFAFPELRRILAPGGRILCVEALAVNPAIQWYRNRTPEMRTEWEKNHILGPKDLSLAKRFFELGEVRYWHLSSIAAAYAPKMLKPLNVLDSVLCKVPGVRSLSWVFTFELLKAPQR